MPWVCTLPWWWAFHDRQRTRVWNTGMKHGYETRVWNKTVFHRYETQVWNTKVFHRSPEGGKEDRGQGGVSVMSVSRIVQSALWARAERNHGGWTKSIWQHASHLPFRSRMCLNNRAIITWSTINYFMVICIDIWNKFFCIFNMRVFLSKTAAEHH